MDRVGFAVVSCGCKNAWAVDLRSASSRCTQCGRKADLQKRQRHWSGDSASEARGAASAIRAALAQDIPIEDAADAVKELVTDPRPASHDSPIDAAAAKARESANHGDRAETVALWLTRLLGPSDEGTYLEAMQKAGLSAERSQKEIIRMLACDIIYEPKVGQYASLTT